MEYSINFQPLIGSWVKDRFGAAHYRCDNGNWAAAPTGFYAFGKWESMWKARGPLVECGPYGRELEPINSEIQNDDSPQIGDVYFSHGSYYTIMSEPYEDGYCFAEVSRPDGSIAPTTMKPSSDHFTKLIKRPPFPDRKTQRWHLSKTGTLVLEPHTAVIYVDHLDIPWRWMDGTLITDDEKKNKHV